ncbi:MAG TPA: L,D-transpeptidase [Pseudonocardiaceae bacterium]|jgi:lipoprotein-anchoring transpeptidase ErfK/SrfK
MLAISGTLLTGTVAMAQQSAVPCSQAAVACVDLASEQAWLVQNGQIVYGPTPITAGKPSAQTPVGRFTVRWKDKNHRSSAFNNAPMPYSVFFTSTGVAFHEGSLKRQSAGCIHLGHNAAVTFYKRLAVGQVVEVVSN